MSWGPAGSAGRVNVSVFWSTKLTEAACPPTMEVNPAAKPLPRIEICVPLAAGLGVRWPIERRAFPKIDNGEALIRDQEEVLPAGINRHRRHDIGDSLAQREPHTEQSVLYVDDVDKPRIGHEVQAARVIQLLCEQDAVPGNERTVNIRPYTLGIQPSAVQGAPTTLALGSKNVHWDAATLPSPEIDALASIICERWE